MSGLTNHLGSRRDVLVIPNWGQIRRSSISEAESTVALQTFSSAISDLVARAAPSVVAVHSHRSRSSGFIWHPGLIVTADEALADEGEVSVTLPGGESLPATLAGRDPSTDIALLGVDRANLQPAWPGPVTAAAGALAIVVGSHGGSPTAALGVVSFAGGGWRSLRGGEIDNRIELDAPIRRSSEGGLALDATGRAFGMAVFGPRRRVLVITSATIDRVAGKLEAHGRIPPGYLGLALQPVRLDGEGVGAMVMSVDANGPGAAAGIRQGDVIVGWDGEAIQSVRALLRALGPDSVGETIRVGLKRAGEPEHADRTDTDAGLAMRELEVLTLLAEGCSNKTFGRRLGISVHTAKFHVRSLIDKLDAIGRTDAVAHAARLGVIHL